MKWEYIGQQELRKQKKTIFDLRPDMWRSRVPGGWLILTVWGTDIKAQSFYPDPDHIWEVDEDNANQVASTLLRPAGKPPLLTEE